MQNFAEKIARFARAVEQCDGTPALWDLQVRGEHLERVVKGVADGQRASTALAGHYHYSPRRT